MLTPVLRNPWLAEEGVAAIPCVIAEATKMPPRWLSQGHMLSPAQIAVSMKCMELIHPVFFKDYVSARVFYKKKDPALTLRGL